MGRHTMRMPLRVAAIGAALAVATLPLFSAASGAAGSNTPTTTTVTATSPAYSGAPIVFTATVTHNSLVPTGSVTFTIIGTDNSMPACDGVVGNSVVLQPNGSGPGAVAQCTISAGLFAAASPYAVTATYSGDFAPSTGTDPKPIRKGATTTTVTSASDPTVTGQPVMFSATVAPVSPATGLPTGTVTFAITGTGGPPPSCDTPEPQPLSGGVATCSVSGGLLAAGSPYTVTATYSGDVNFATSAGSTSQDVDRAKATIGVTSSSVSLDTGQPVTFTATVTGITPPGFGTPTGSIVFSVVGSEGTIETCDSPGDTVPLSGSPLSAQCNFASGLPAKSLSYTVSASLQDPNFKSPVAGTLVQQINRPQSTTAVGGLPGSLVASQAFTFHVAVKTTAPGTGAPTGDVEWAVCPNEETCTPQTGTKGGTFNLPTPTATENHNSKNKATISVPGGLTPGFYDVTATYEGDFNLKPSTSTVGHILITTVPTTMDLIANHNPILSGGRLVIRAAVIANSRATDSLGAPSQTITFTITGGGEALTCASGSNTIDITTNAQNQGLAKCVIVAGQITSTNSPYRVKAVYSGDSNYDGVTGIRMVTVEG